MKKAIAIFFLIILFVPIAAFAEEGVNGDIIKEQYMSEEFDDIRELVDKAVTGEVSSVLSGLSFNDIMGQATTGNFSFNIGDVLKSLAEYAFSEVKNNINILIRLLVIALITGFIVDLTDVKASKAAIYTCYLVATGVMIQGFSEVMSLTENTLAQASVFMNAIVPGMMGIMVSTGNVSSMAAFQPVVYIMLQIVSFCMTKILIPLTLFMFVLALTEGVSDNFHISGMKELIKSICKWSMTTIFMVFVGTLAVLGFVTSTIDGVAGKMVKQTVSNVIPVVGNIVADSADAVISCMSIVKNGFGVVGIVSLLAICLMPVIKIFIINMMYRICAAIAEPISECKLCTMIESAAEACSYLTSIIIGVTALFIVSIAILVSAGNISIMYR